MLLEGIINLGVAKYLQENCDCQLSTLIDTNNHTKKFFQDQKIVKFHKIWYFRDYIIKSNKNIDVDYLSNFEQKYNIFLWKIIHGDRILTNHDGTNNYHKFQRNEILQILEQECKLYEQILDDIKPDFAIIKNPDYSQSQILFELCNSQNIPVLTLGSGRLGTRSIISNKVDIIDNVNKIFQSASDKKFESFEEFQKLLHGYNIQIKTMIKESNSNLIQKKIRAGWYMLTKILNDEYRKFYVNYGRTRLRILINESNLILKKWRRERFINKNLKRELNFDVPFLYFPLQLQPERTILLDSPHYTNQLELISQISRSMPINFKLYVKEHPSQSLHNWRESSFYKKIQSIPNVELFHPSIPSQEILKHCSLVFSINGTSCLEAAFYEKPSIIFDDVLYSVLPSVFRVKSYEYLTNIIKQALNSKVSISDLNKYVNTVLDNSFDFDYVGINTKIAKRIPNSDYVPDIELEENDVVEILKEIQNDINILGSEYLKKINQYKKTILPNNVDKNNFDENK